ncbi:MAG TPA: PAS domain-containing sensor histidine kinase [Hanamia sp.]|nr:PAS domain-containing sensor histidine kinase [Hanamia sp.]
MKELNTTSQLSEIEILRQKLDEANDTIDAIRAGKVDAFIVKDKEGHRIYTLKSADQTYRVFIEKMIEGAVTLNKKGIILYSNSRFASMIHISLSKIMGSYFQQYVSVESTAVFNTLVEKGWKEECKGEISLITDNGKVIPVLISLTTLELDEGTALSLILTDLTSQKNIEKQLREKNEQLEAAKLFTEKLNNELELRVKERTNELLASREHFKFLADTIPVIVWTAKPDGDFDYFNRQWYDYTGLTFEESKGNGWQSVLHPDDLQNVVNEWNRCALSGQPFKFEERMRNARGKYFSHISNALPFKNSEGEIIAWFGVCTNIEDQKREMEKKDEFISMASHELKTPVTSLKAYTEILMMNLKPQENEGAISMLRKMDKQIDKLTSLIGDLLDVSKSKSGQLNFSFEKIDLNELMHEVTGIIQLSSSKHKIELHLSDTQIIKGDRNRLGQVIANLLSNAIKYSPNADKIIVSSVNSKDQVKICVKDFGIGIPLSEQSKLFSRFFRVSNNTYPGLGLGLYICNEIIHRHSGTMEFQSEEGKGSMFCFTLPVINNN